MRDACMCTCGLIFSLEYRAVRNKTVESASNPDCTVTNQEAAESQVLCAITYEITQLSYDYY